MAMRVHITLDEGLIERLDHRVGTRKRSSYIEEAVRRSLDQDERWDKIWSAVGSIPDTGHEWDEDPAAWVHSSRRADSRRVG
jgi:predicted transcriptional regulator